MEKFNESGVVEVSETIKEIPGFSRYLCDIENGRIWRKPTETRQGSWLKQSPNAIGYCGTTLVNDEGKKQFAHIHEIVMSAAIESPKNFWREKNLEIDHRDRCKSNNKITNLHLVKKSKNHENIQNRKSPRVLTSDEVKYIIEQFNKWEGKKIEFYQNCALFYDTCWQTIQYTVLGYNNRKKLIVND